MDYFTASGVILRTGYKDKKYWYILCIKELLDNAVDFLWKYYQGYSDTSITVYVTQNDSLLHIKMRNSNSQNIQVFQNIALIFDPDMRYGSKQDVRIISRGMLGDALKQVLALGYVLIHSSDDGTAFSNEQWNNPLIIRCNGKEVHVRIIVDQSNQTHRLDIKEVQLLGHTDTEIEISLPMIADLDIDDIEVFCRTYPLLTTDISFKFRLVDNSSDKPGAVQVEYVPSTRFEGALEQKIVQAFSARPRKAAINIEYPALHPISTKWNNVWTIHTMMPAEFISMITNVYDKEFVTIYERLQSGREGNNMKKTDENKMSIAEFLSDPDYYKKLEKLFWDLKSALGAPKELSLPYSDNKERKQALVSRVCVLYPLLDPDKAVYKIVRGLFTDDKWKKVWDADGEAYRNEKGKGILEYPFAVEFLVVPYSNASLHDDEYGRSVNRASKFIGSVNYSLSPRSNEFAGDYEWHDKDGYRENATSMTNILKTYGFRFYEYSDSKVKIPSVILVNIISQRVDYHGHDKSGIDTHAFTDTIIQAAKKISDSVQTFRAAGFVFFKERSHDRAPINEKKMSAKDLFGTFLDRIRTGGSLDVQDSGL